jgi:signal transduction histidine kinase
MYLQTYFMNKPGIIFAFVSIYAVAAFSWWTFAHIRSSQQLYEDGKQNLELLCYKATNDVSGAIAQSLFNDTNQLKEYVTFNFPQLEIIFVEPEKQINPMDYYLIRPMKASYDKLETKRKRSVSMYGLEGVVMVILLFWGIVWIYRSLHTRLAFNKQQNNFMLSITHELKTPLASVKLYIETLLKRDLDKEQSKLILRNSLSELVRLKDLVNNILMAAQLEDSKFHMYSTEVNLSEIASESFEKFVTPRSVQDRFNLEVEPEIYIEGDPIGLETVIINLLSNAYKYGGSTGFVTMKVFTTGERVHIIIADEGQGISEQDKKNLFKRFYRSGDEQTRKSKGTGLGLFIVKNLLNLMKGEISVRDNHPKGTIFEITFTRYNAI